MPQPVFSVVVPTYNRPRIIMRAIRSVLNQTFDNFELIVVDDGSTENYTAARSLASPRVKWVTHQTNRGAAAARNTGIAHAQGHLVSFLDDDDEFLPSFLEVTYRYWAIAPDDAGPSWTQVRKTGFPEGTAPSGDHDGEPDDPFAVETFLAVGTGYGVTIPARLLTDVGLFDENLRCVEDTDLFLRLVVAGYRPRQLSGRWVLVHSDAPHRLTDDSNSGVRLREASTLVTTYLPLLGDYPTVRGQLLHHVECLQTQTLKDRRRSTDAPFSDPPAADRPAS
ncbi:hypothetical protein Acsp06_62600 [Actinomycetospora sp. NBRC 106375]|uniref:glycosyltransferase family 2 protein n=1 Tax=Actinomycetospora sp. NBRC 106375 TaxID=3032207 RepID=UPI0024A45B50|nr:glycosyltransferase family A protein [Actinomycetospora sp. NBRC 106375]GLZ50075.1 hypothetical protein Acsp06_62600 [Actinomycetospora sp. NBRC 106375]